MTIYDKIEMLVEELEHLGASSDILKDWKNDPDYTVKDTIADVREWLVHIRMISKQMTKTAQGGML